MKRLRQAFMSLALSLICLSFGAINAGGQAESMADSSVAAEYVNQDSQNDSESLPGEESDPFADLGITIIISVFM
jgi:hypothetical protein